MQDRKSPVQRKAEFITTAEALFLEKGFENTSVDDIVNRLGVAKGLFYYYFDSKEDLLVAITGRILDEVQSTISSAMERKDATAMEHFKALIPSNLCINARSKLLIAYFRQERNQAFHHLMEERATAFLVPAIERIIRQGIEEDVFHTDYPHEAAIALMAVLQSLRGAVPGPDRKDWSTRLTTISQEMAERILDAKPGTFSVLSDSLPPGIWSK
jgi:AcrR family transcriptional regulator